MLCFSSVKLQMVEKVREGKVPNSTGIPGLIKSSWEGTRLHVARRAITHLSADRRLHRGCEQAGREERAQEGATLLSDGAQTSTGVVRFRWEAKVLARRSLRSLKGEQRSTR
jgi:hypothetical protein